MHRRQTNQSFNVSNMHRRPSVALADYDISDRRSSAMSSLLLLFALFEGMCGFVLPICSAFRVSNITQKRYYYENFLIFQYCLSILALAYLQSLIFYYDRKENLRHKQEILFMNQMNEARRIWPDHQTTSEERENNHINNTSNNNNNNNNTTTTNDYSENQWNLQLQKCDDKLRLVTFINNTHELTTDGYSDSISNHLDSPNMKYLEDRTRFIDHDYDNGNISSIEDEEHSLEETLKKSNNKLNQYEQKSSTLSVTFANPITALNKQNDNVNINDNNNNNINNVNDNNSNKNNKEEERKPPVNNTTNQYNDYKVQNTNERNELHPSKLQIFNNITNYSNNEQKSSDTNDNNHNNNNHHRHHHHHHQILKSDNKFFTLNEVKPSNSYTHRNSLIINDINNNIIQSKLNVKTKRNNKNKVTNENISTLNKRKITTCCSHQSNYPTGGSPFHPLAILFGDKPKVSRRECYFSRDTEGVNLYLRLGAVGFGFGVMIFDGFKIAEPWEEGASSVVSCHGHLWIPLHLLHFIYVFWQTYFLFKHHRVVFNVQKFVLRFLLCHLAVANLCQWLKTIVDEIGSEPGHDEEPTSKWNIVSPSEYLMDSNITHGNTSIFKYASSVNRTKHNVATVPHRMNHDNATVNAVEQAVLGCGVTVKYLAPYLFPCAIEYSLIAGAIFYKMFEKVGHVRKESERLEKLRKANPKISQFSECHRSHKGLFVGLLLFMATLVAMSLFFIFIVKRDRRNTAITLYQGTELVLLSVSTLTCLISLFRLQALKLSDLSEEVAFDDNLLLIGLVGMLFYDLFLLVPALEAIPNGVIAAKLYAAKAIMEMIQSMLQVFFILEASRRCAGTLEHIQKKPGRTMITFLLVLNLAMWFVNTFEVKHADNHSIHINYYSSMAWKIITHIALPLIVFFRFHSTVCLSDIWANAYRFRTE
ncbi:otopetrin isoform 2 [Schistosoma japonicum]|uniref:Otopetrin isoform 2 n=1 Tax=Schistosoma japonicum TaxID=6182 RepID=A0A4Z2D9Y9_SCHJA|nr:otopetrin isoform 2 [Schistosoma japonicum]